MPLLLQLHLLLQLQLHQPGVKSNEFLSDKKASLLLRLDPPRVPDWIAQKRKKEAKNFGFNNLKANN